MSRPLPSPPPDPASADELPLLDLLPRTRRRNAGATPDPDPWAVRFGQLARASGLAGEPLALALSGGADSVLLLHLVAAARPRPDVIALHVHHGLRGPDADLDADFCRELCKSLGVPFTRLDVRLDPDPAGLEERARIARYTALLGEARRRGRRVLLTAHHADDGLETLLMRWLRGAHVGGLVPARAELLVRGPYPGAPPEAGLELAPVRIVRPLRAMRREEVRRLLTARGLTWREDRSNDDPRFARNRVRSGLLPLLDDVLGESARDGLLDFARAVERLEDSLAAATVHLWWRPFAHAVATRGPQSAGLGGRLPREELAGLPAPLLRRALWRLVVEGTGRAPQREMLDALARDLLAGRTGRRSLPGAWTLVLRAGEVQLLPPRRALGIVAAGAPACTQGLFPFAEPGPKPLGCSEEHALRVPGIARLADGRAIVARCLDAEGASGVPRAAETVELDACGLPEELSVRFPRAGDRFHPLGGPGSRPLVRFLADAGVPREERALVPLVVSGAEILWVVGLRPAETRRVRATTRRRLRLALVAEGALRAG